MEFIYSNYTSSIQNLGSEVYSKLTGSLSWSANSGIISRMDVVPQSGSLYLLELNTNLTIWNHIKHFFRFDDFRTYLGNNSYNVLEFHKVKDADTDSLILGEGFYGFFEELSSSMAQSNISTSLHLDNDESHVSYETSANTTYRLYNSFPSNRSLLHDITMNKMDMRNALGSSYFPPTASDLSSFSWDNSSNYPDLVIKETEKDASTGIYFFDSGELSNYNSTLWNFRSSSQAYAEKFIVSDRVNDFGIQMTSHFIIDNSNIFDVNQSTNNLYYHLQNPIKGNLTPFTSLNIGNVSSSWTALNVESMVDSVLSGDSKVEMSDGSFKTISTLSRGDVIKQYTTDDSIKYMDSMYSGNFDCVYNTSATNAITSSITNSTTLTAVNKTVECLLPAKSSNMITIDGKIKIGKHGSILTKPQSESNYRMNAVSDLIHNNFSILDSDGNSQTISTGSISDSNSIFDSYKIIFDGDTNHYQTRFFNVEGYLVLEC